MHYMHYSSACETRVLFLKLDHVLKCAQTACDIVPV